eukprot:CAMPEP_0119263432 /NCGR_PEP_ID=MMETSP1329-20130426/2838_1 /TAXON_ID=114041 /ORGANISM="Genus nov. species nov., Strain RCC1024" /LENGTH=70 /DNA_ID=CAMNT_0007263133 /DNA_START=284 /DNA_END=493 /DNA_ORIENTATION=+
MGTFIKFCAALQSPSTRAVGRPTRVAREAAAAASPRVWGRTPAHRAWRPAVAGGRGLLAPARARDAPQAL